MTDFHEHQSVRTLRRVGEIAPGERGVIVHAYAIGDAYEVEFGDGLVEFVDGVDLEGVNGATSSSSPLSEDRRQGGAP